MNDGTIAKIKEVNQWLSDLVGLPYTDFYKADRFVALFELPIDNHLYFSTISDMVCRFTNLRIFNRISFLEKLAIQIENCLQAKGSDIHKVIRAIQREFKGLGE